MVIGEAALRQEVGSPEVMEGQLGLLAGVSGDSGVDTVQILPFSSGAHAATGVGSLTILQFLEAPGLGVVHLGGAGGGVCLEGQEDLAAHARCSSSLERSRSVPHSPRSCFEGRRLSKRHVAYAVAKGAAAQAGSGRFSSHGWMDGSCGWRSCPAPGPGLRHGDVDELRKPGNTGYRWRRHGWAITEPLARSNAANRLVVPLRR